MEKNKKNTEEECSSISNGKPVEHANKILCDCQRGKPDRVMGYVSETDEPWRYEIYKVAKEHFDKAVYLLQAETGIHINSRMAEELAEKRFLTSSCCPALSVISLPSGFTSVSAS